MWLAAVCSITIPFFETLIDSFLPARELATFTHQKSLRIDAKLTYTPLMNLAKPFKE
jgi:hypothetical protein